MKALGKQVGLVVGFIGLTMSVSACGSKGEDAAPANLPAKERQVDGKDSPEKTPAPDGDPVALDKPPTSGDAGTDPTGPPSPPKVAIVVAHWKGDRNGMDLSLPAGPFPVSCKGTPALPSTTCLFASAAGIKAYSGEDAFWFIANGSYWETAPPALTPGNPDPQALNPGKLIVEAQVTLHAGGAWRQLLAKDDGGNNRQWWFGVTDKNQLFATVWATDGSSVFALGDKKVVPLSEAGAATYVKVGMQFDGDRVAVYLADQLVGSSKALGKPMRVTTEPVRVSHPSQGWFGAVDEVKIMRDAAN